MSSLDIHPIPAPPNILKALRGGFDAIANQASIILIPVLLDIWLWLGPHVQVKEYLTGLLQGLYSAQSAAASGSGVPLQLDIEMVEQVLDRVNLMTLLRSYPVGIPSLVSGILPMEAPLGSPMFVNVSSPWQMIGLWLCLTLVGTLAGAYYFLVISQAALSGQVKWRAAVTQWPRMAQQAVVLTLAAGLFVLILLVPASCVLSVISLGGIPVSQIAVIVFSGMLIWVAFPLVFTPLELFSSRINLLAAVRRSIMVTRMTLPNTVLFIVLLLVLSQGFDILWRVPEETSWFTLVGLAGHGFVASGLLAAAFVYYRDADAWVQRVMQGMRQAEPM